MKYRKLSFIVILLLLSCSVLGASNVWTSSNDAVTNNKGFPRITGESLNTNWTTNNIAGCVMEYQPLVYDLNGDSLNEIIVFCGSKIKAYDYQGNLQAEKIIGDLQGSAAIAIKDDLSYNIVAVINMTNGNKNLSYFDFNGTLLSLNKSYDVNTVGGGDAAFCPVANNVCSALPESVLSMDIGGDDYFCRLQGGLFECYENSDLTGTVGLNFSHGLTCDYENKFYIVDFDGGDDNIIFSCGRQSTNAHTLKYYDSTGTTIWTKSTSAHNFYSSFIDYYNGYACMLDQSTGGAAPLDLVCYDHAGTNQLSASRNGVFIWETGLKGIKRNTLMADFNNDGFQDVYTQGGVLNLQNFSGALLDFADKYNYNVIVSDLNLDGSLDYIVNSGTDFDLVINEYSNEDPVITLLSYDTGNPVCLGSSIKYTVNFEDVEGDFGQIRVDAYGDGNYTSYGNLGGFPYQSVVYNQLGTYTSLIQLKDESGNFDNITHGVIVQISNCYNSGENGGDSSQSTVGDTADIGGFNIKDGETDGYTPSDRLYNSNNSIYFDSSRCVERYGANWQRMVIPCPVKLLVIDGLDQIQAWVIGSFIFVIIVLIGFMVYLMVKHNGAKK